MNFFFFLTFTFAVVFAMLMCTGPVNEALSRSRSDLAEPLVNFLFCVVFFCIYILLWFGWVYSELSLLIFLLLFIVFLWSRVHCTLSHSRSDPGNSSVNFFFRFFLALLTFFSDLFFTLSHPKSAQENLPFWLFSSLFICGRVIRENLTDPYTHPIFWSYPSYINVATPFR